MSNTSARPVLVLGGTGTTGRRVVQGLSAQGVQTRVGSRFGEPPFDWQNESTWAAALDGARSAYVTYPPDLAVPGAVEAVRSFADLAVARDVTRLVLLSGRGEPEAESAEHAVRASGADLTVLRCAWFMQNFSEGRWREHVLSGELRLPAGGYPLPFLHADDLAEVAVAALTDDRHRGQVYELTGPRSLTFGEVAAEIAAATGRPQRYVPVSLEQHAHELAAQGASYEAIDLLTYVFEVMVNDRNGRTTDDVWRVLRREPRDFAEYARTTAATGVWDSSAVAA